MLTMEMILEVVKKMISVAEKYDPEMVFAIVLQMYAGLRSAEVCSLRQEGSVFGPSVSLAYADEGRQDCTGITIDLLHDHPLRSDAGSTGWIKTKRVQEVFPEYIPIIETAYKQHLDLIRSKPVETSRPLFLCRYPDKKTGAYMALTVRGYRSRLRRLYYDYTLPACSDDINPVLRRYFREVSAKKWSPKNLRQWYLLTLITKTTRKEDLVRYSTIKDLRLQTWIIDEERK